MTSERRLRLWPGVTLAILEALFLFGGSTMFPNAEFPVGLLGGVACALGIVIWWVLFSRVRWVERIAAVVLTVIGVYVLRQISHLSIVGAGQGMMLYGLPPLLVAPALVVWAVIAGGRSDAVRRLALVAIVALALAPFALIRTDGVQSGALFAFHWRWTPTAEDRLLAQASDDPKPIPTQPVPESVAAPAAPSNPASTDAVRTTPAPGATIPAAPPSEKKAHPPSAPVSVTASETPERIEWPGFRGPSRDGIVHGVQIKTDWNATPPVELWRRPIGPGWSSFAVHQDLIYTQEQRGTDELVSAYRLSTGEPVWRHRDAVRFYESNGGPGPRATPTLSNGRVYALGATGILNALDARTGAVLWSRNAATDTEKAVPDWGIASSPIVVDGLVIAAVAGRLIAYDAVSGLPRWTGQPGGAGYSSPHLATIAGVPQVLLIRGSRTISVAPADGTLLWEHAAGPPAAGIVQPAVAGDDTVLIASTDAMTGNGITRVAVAHGPGGWTVTERWTSRGLKPYFNDFVVHKGHAFGFDGAILSCIDLENGERKWKGGRYGNGQLILIADQDLLLVTSEEGELALVSATADKFTEIAKVPVMTSKTWNHPVLINDVLLVRNGEEMAAFRLSPADHTSSRNARTGSIATAR